MPPDTRTETTTGIKWKAQENKYQNENKHYEVLSGWLNRPSIPTACNASQIRGIFRVFYVFRFSLLVSTLLESIRHLIREEKEKRYLRHRKSLAGSATETGPLDAEKLGQGTTSLKT